MQSRGATSLPADTSPLSSSPPSTGNNPVTSANVKPTSTRTSGGLQSLVGRVFSTVTDFYKDINPSTLSGAVDVVVVEGPIDPSTGDHELICSPFHVRFGKLQLLRPQEKVVEMSVNGIKASLNMKVGEAGEAFFVFETQSPVPRDYETSPLASPIPAEEMVENVGEMGVFELDTQDSQMNITTTLTDGATTARMTNSSARRSLSIDSVSNRNVEVSAVPIRTALSDTEADNAQQVPAVNISTSAITTTNDETYSFPAQQPEKILESTSQPPNGSNSDIASGNVILTFGKAITSEYYISQILNTPWPDEESSSFESLVVSNACELSLCAHVTVQNLNDFDGLEQTFKQFLVTFEQFSSQPQLLSDPNLVCKLNNRFFSWTTAAPLLIGLVVYKRSVPLALFKQLVMQQLLVSDTKKDSAPSQTVSTTVSNPIPANANHSKTYSFGGIRSWFSRGRRADEESGASNTSASVASATAITTPTSTTTVTGVLLSKSPPTTATSSNNAASQSKTNSSSKLPEINAAARARSLSPLGRSLSLMESKANHARNDENKARKIVDSSDTAWRSGNEATMSSDSGDEQVHYAKTLRLTSEQLKSLHLKYGVNSVSFSVATRLQGKASCNARIFYWKQDAKVIISDIDGTITKSDVFGHLFTMVGRDWTHPGVAKLYTDICRNGYQILYLTSRAIGQANYTREYLRGVEQDKYQLPDGPVIMSPDRLLTAFHREVIIRKPEEFKIACLRDIQRLFRGKSPFYAGFGNRITDSVAYRSVGVPSSRIFIINSQGELRLEQLSGYMSSYTKLTDLVDHIFPLIRSGTDSSEEHEPIKEVESEFTDLHYWKMPIPDVDELLMGTNTKSAAVVNALSATTVAKNVEQEPNVDEEDDEGEEVAYPYI